MLLVNLLLKHLRIQMIFSISDAETQSGNEPETSDNVNDNVHDDAQPSNDNDIEIEPDVDLHNLQSQNQRYHKRDFVARKHGKERET